MNEPPERLVPDRDFPAYGYVPGHWPHPENDPEGHSFDEEEPLVNPLDPDDWKNCPDYLFGLDLFNFGYYWEAHESWEQLWHAAGRSGPTADFLRAMIKFAAAGVKVRQGNSRGIERHASSAINEFQQLTQRIDDPRFCGFSLDQLQSYGERIRNHQSFDPDPDAPRERVFSFLLIPESTSGHDSAQAQAGEE